MSGPAGRVLVTGAGGFVGGYVAQTLAERGASVVALMRRPIERTFHRNVSVALADLAAADPLPDGPFTAHIHCAAAIPASIPDEAELIRVNVESMRRVLDHADKSGSRCFINCSSMAAFGAITTPVVDANTPIQNPGAYGRSKLQCEQLLAVAAETGGWRTFSFRLPGVVGLGSHHNFLSDVMTSIVAGKPVRARNPDALFNNIVHVADLAPFFADLVEMAPKGHRVVTIAADEPAPMKAVIGALYESAGREPQATFEPGSGSFIISPEPARALGFTPPKTLVVARRFACDSIVASGP